MGAAVSATSRATVGGSVISYEAAVDEQGAVFFVFFDEPAAFANLLSAERQLFEGFGIGENVILAIMITEPGSTVLRVGDGHTFAL
jgi:hypothetical protein